MKTALLAVAVALFAATSLFATGASAQCLSMGFGYTCAAPVLVAPPVAYYGPDWIVGPGYRLDYGRNLDAYWMNFETRITGGP